MKRRVNFLLTLCTFVFLISCCALLYRFLKPVNTIGEIKNGFSNGQLSADGNTVAVPGQDTQTQVQAAEKSPATDFKFTDYEGNEHKLSDFFGKPIVINFWASWCPPCREELPHFETVYKELGEEVVFLMMDLTDGSSETVESGSKFINENGYTFPVYFDTMGEGSIAYGTTSIPMTVLIDKDGNYYTRAVGAIDEATLRRGVGFIYQP